ncbi:MAG: FkbM family methyltransferase [Phycisphaerales bacterium JB039]
MAIALSVTALALVLILHAVSLGRSRRQGRRLRRLQEHTLRRMALLEQLMRATCARAAAAALQREGAAPAMPIEFRSQHGEDVFLYELLDGQRHGFFIEAGAFDGYTMSTSYAFEAMGWRGLLVEPIPQRCEQARQRRAGSRVVHGALGRRGATGEIQIVRYASAEELCSHVIDAGVAGRPAGPEQLETVTAPLIPLDRLLEDEQAPIDFFVLDVEGAELDALDGFDLARHRPRIMIVEDHSMEHDSAVGMRLHDCGYVTAGWIAYNRIMIAAHQPALLERARTLLSRPEVGLPAPEAPPGQREPASG